MTPVERDEILKLLHERILSIRNAKASEYDRDIKEEYTWTIQGINEARYILLKYFKDKGL